MTTPPAAQLTPVPKQPADRGSAWITGVGAVVLIAAGIANIVATNGFPYNAPVEWFWSLGITIDLLAGAAALVAVTVLRLVRKEERVPGPGIGALAIIAAIAGVVAFVAWFPFGGADFIGRVVQGDRLRYYITVTGILFAGIPWMLGIVTGVIAIRRGRSRLHNLLALVGIVLGALLMLVALFASIVYGLALTD